MAENLKQESGTTSCRPFLAVAALIACHVCLLAYSAIVHSPNVNEPAHLAAGISHWTMGRFGLYRVNPPLVRAVAAIPVLAAGVKVDWTNFSESNRVRAEFWVGPDLIEANGERSLFLMTLARFMCIPFSVVGAIACYLWARDLYGPQSGILSCALWCFSPTILGHASCITPDGHAAAMGVAGSYLFWKWLKKPTWARAIGAGFLLGLILLTKITWIILFAVWPLIWIVWQVLSVKDVPRDGRPTMASKCLQMICILVIGLHVLNMGYLYGGTFTRLGDFTFISKTLVGPDAEEGNRFRNTLLANVPVPLPEQYVLGADVQKAEHDQCPDSYLRGELTRHGYWYFYLYAFAVKEPLGELLLLGIAVFVRFVNRRSIRIQDEICLLCPAIAIVLLVSSETNFTAHYRYAIIALPFLFVWIGRVWDASNRMGARNALVLICLAGSIGSSLAYAPHWLSYFNEISGGPAKGDLHLANSNLDWGQDLVYLQKWLKRHPEVESLGLAYYGMFHPHAIGMEFTDVPSGFLDAEAKESPAAGRDQPNGAPQPGWYAVSVNFITGHPFWNFRADGKRGWHERGGFTWLRELQPVGRAGYSIRIYHISEADSERLRPRFYDDKPALALPAPTEPYQ